MLKNTLKFALIVFGALFSIYGLYIILTPDLSLNEGPLELEAKEGRKQAYAMLIFGVLLILAGLSFKKR